MNTRDGRCTSLWQSARNIYRPQSPRIEKNFDVIVIGGGITGISTALQLQEAGLSCLVLEARHLCFGTTGGTTAHINTLLDTPYTTIENNFGKANAKLVAAAAKDAVDLISSNIRRYGIDCGFAGAVAYLFAQDEDQDQELSKIAAAAEEAGLSLAASKIIPLNIPFTKAVRVAGQAKFHPVDYVFALAKSYEHIGGTIIDSCRVTGAEVNELVEVTTNRGVFKTKDIVYATHIPPGINLLHLRCSPMRSYAMAVQLTDDAYPEDLSYDMYDPYHYYRTQEVDGQPYLIVGGNDHRTGDNINTRNCFLQLENHVRQHFNVKKVKFRWSSQYFEPADGLPYIGHLPGHPEHVYVATGFGGNGMTYSSVAARLLPDLILGKENPYADVFNPNRLKPVAGFTNFIKHNADVAATFVKQLFSGEDLPELTDLAPGEARIVNYEDRKIAMYKDTAGEVHAIQPTCTHMKCEVRWNSAETSWDCPCHGARYDPDGKVLTGPADRDLTQIELHMESTQPSLK